MKEKQDHIYFMASSNRADAEASPFVERLLRKGYEVLFLVDPVDEYCLQSLPEFEGKKFQVRATAESVRVENNKALGLAGQNEI